MNPRTTGVLALIALALGAFVYLYEIGGDAEREAAKEEAARVFSGFDSGEVTAIELTTREGVATRFELRGGEWRVTRPIDAPADPTALDAIAHALANLPRKGEVKASRSLDEYGLAGSARVVRFEVERAGGVEEKSLRIGRSTPVGGHLYVAGDDHEDVAFVEAYRVNAFNRKFDNLRRRRILDFEAGSVDWLALRWSEGSGSERVEFARGPGGLWRMTQPVEAMADEETIRDLLSNLSFLRAQHFVDVRTEAVDAALANPLIEIAWQSDSEQEPLAARIARGDEEGELLVDTGLGSDVAYRIAAERLEDFPRTINAYRFKELASFELAAARRLEFEFAPAAAALVSTTAEPSPAEPVRIVAELAEAGWQSADRDLDPDRLSDLVRDLSALRAEDLFADEMGSDELASLGLAPPLSVVGVFGKDLENPLAEIALGRLDARHGLFVQRVGDPTIYLLPGERAESLPINLEAFESRFQVRAPAEEDTVDAGADADEESESEFEGPGIDADSDFESP